MTTAHIVHHVGVLEHRGFVRVAQERRLPGTIQRFWELTVPATVQITDQRLLIDITLG